MLREISAVRQDQADLRRRWFQDDYFDLFVWVAPEGGIVAFQLAYDRGGDERVLGWHRSAATCTAMSMAARSRCSRK
jgi:hypothetical protein